MEVVKLHTNDGLDLTAWYRPAYPQHPTIVYLHGNAGHIGHRAIIVRPFLSKGYGVLLVTYRGYSGNPGKPHEEGFYQDGRAAFRFLQEKGVPDSCIVIYGESIGAAVAVQMATEFQAGALVLQSPFTSLGDIGQFHYPIFPVKLLIKEQYNSLEKAGRIHSPVLVLYGGSDNVIPPAFSKRLFEALSTSKQLQEIPDIGHNDLFPSRTAIKFIEEHVYCKEEEGEG